MIIGFKTDISNGEDVEHYVRVYMKRLIGFLLLLGVGTVVTLIVLIKMGIIGVGISYVFIPGFIILLILGTMAWMFLALESHKIYRVVCQRTYDKMKTDAIAKGEYEIDEKGNVKFEVNEHEDDGSEV